MDTHTHTQPAGVCVWVTHRVGVDGGEERWLLVETAEDELQENQAEVEVEGGEA